MGRIGFGQLWALNEEMLAPAKSIPLHAHENMEIISIPLSGTLRHQDSRGVSHTIAPGDVHVLSAGLGITHWEFNNSASEPAHFLQIWINPRSRMTPTRYAQAKLDEAAMKSRFSLITAPAGSNGLIDINQDAYVSMANLEPGAARQYEKFRPTNGVYVFVIAGQVKLDLDELGCGNGTGLTESVLPSFLALQHSTVLCIEVPL